MLVSLCDLWKSNNRAGKIKLAGEEYNVTFQLIDNDPALTAKIDEANTERYSNSIYFSPMLGKGPVSATAKILPRNE
ncbi:DUF2255 family protein [Oceanobacillus chungangensis]|uniref:DUF2255 family protein n=1 Tax=Oceanobacillus chungangensis TaxID=1229152 RepID=UPI001FE677B1|nr:DUF2255 family protein [Oceanobacillus chungangensis]